MIFRSAVATTLLVFSLTSCAVAWGSAHKVEFANQSSITINFDPSLTNMGEVQTFAQKHCSQFGKDAIPGQSDTSFWHMRTISFVCQKRE